MLSALSIIGKHRNCSGRSTIYIRFICLLLFRIFSTTKSTWWLWIRVINMRWSSTWSRWFNNYILNSRLRKFLFESHKFLSIYGRLLNLTLHFDIILRIFSLCMNCSFGLSRRYYFIRAILSLNNTVLSSESSNTLNNILSYLSALYHCRGISFVIIKTICQFLEEVTSLSFLH